MAFAATVGDVVGFSDSVETPAGRIALYGNVRGGDELGHNMFRIDLKNRPTLYGEYKQKFSDNQYDFDIEIVSFGFRNPRYVGDPGDPLKISLTAEDRVSAENLLQLLFGDNPEGNKARKDIGVFSIPQSKFLGRLHFIPGWAREERFSSREVKS